MGKSRATANRFTCGHLGVHHNADEKRSKFGDLVACDGETLARYLLINHDLYKKAQRIGQ